MKATRGAKRPPPGVPVMEGQAVRILEYPGAPLYGGPFKVSYPGALGFRIPSTTTVFWYHDQGKTWIPWEVQPASGAAK
jgi:hypothetical protein